MTYTITEVREDLGSDVVDEFIELFGYVTIEDVKPEDIYESFCGRWDSGAEYLEDLCEQCGGTEGIPEPYKRYIDYEAMWRDEDMNGGHCFNEDTGHVWNMCI